MALSDHTADLTSSLTKSEPVETVGGFRSRIHCPAVCLIEADMFPKFEPCVFNNWAFSKEISDHSEIDTGSTETHTGPCLFSCIETQSQTFVGQK